MKIKINNGAEDKLVNSVAFVLCFLLSKNILFSLPQFLQFQGVINAGVSVIILVIFIQIIDIIFKRQPITVMATIFGLIVFALFQILVFTDNESYVISSVPKILIYGIIPFLIVSCIRDYDLLIQRLHLIGRFVVIIGIVGFTGIIWSSDIAYNYSMSFGDSVSVGVVIVEYFALQNKKAIDILLLVCGVIIIFIGGSRSGLIVLIVYFILHSILLPNSEHKGRKLVYYLKITVIIIVCFLCYDLFIKFGVKVMDYYKIQSRTLELLFSGNFIRYDSGRSWIYNKCLEGINNHPFIGIGYEGLKGTMGLDGWTPHNTYLELLSYYGIIVGSICILLLIILWIHGLLYKSDKSKQVIIVIFASLYIPRSFVGAGILENSNFWILLSLCINSAIQHRKQTLLGRKSIDDK